MNIIRTSSVRRLKLCALFVVSAYFWRNQRKCWRNGEDENLTRKQVLELVSSFSQPGLVELPVQFKLAANLTAISFISYARNMCLNIMNLTIKFTTPSETTML